MAHTTQPASRNVVVRLGALGDVLLTTGVLRYWHKRYGARCTMLTRQHYVSLFEGHPAVDECIGLEEHELRLPHMVGVFLNLAERFVGIPLIDLHGNLRTRALAFAWKGPVLRYPKHALLRRLFLASNGRLGRQKLQQHNVTQRYAMAVDAQAPSRKDLLPCVFVSEAEQRVAADRLSSFFAAQGWAEPEKLHPVALHPFAAHQAKAWPKSCWLSLIQALNKAGQPWFVLGRGNVWPELLPSQHLVNSTSLRESAALLARAKVLVTADSGPMHLAAAVATPVVALFGPTTPEWGFYPEGAHDRVLETALGCRPCSLHGGKGCVKAYECMRSIRVEAVFEAVLGILNAEQPTDGAGGRDPRKNS